MSVTDFIADTATRRLIERAGRAAGMPLSLHPIGPGQEEGLRVCGVGACQACSFIAGIPGGRQACRDSRAMPARQCLRQKRPIPFICHLGFACLAAPLRLSDADLVITIGPWNPADASRSLEYDACTGLEALNGTAHETFPAPLDDIRMAPTAAPTALAEWLVADLTQLWERYAGHTDQAMQEDDAAAMDARPSPSQAGKRKSGRAGLTTLEQYPGKAIAAALIAQDSAQARTLFEGAMEAQVTPNPQRQAEHCLVAQQLRCAAIVASVLEHLAAIGHGCPTTVHFVAWLEANKAVSSSKELIREALAFLRKQLPKAAPSAYVDSAAPTERSHKPVQSPQARKLEQNLKAILKARKLQNDITLQEVADALGETPSAITHRMKKLLGMHFSEYLGRMRVEEAKRLLRQTKLSATDVAKRVGIADQSNFSKRFKKYTGMSPLDYRKSTQRSS